MSDATRHADDPGALRLPGGGTRRSRTGGLTIEQGRIGWVGPGQRARGRPRPGQRGDRSRVRQRPHPPRARAARPAGRTPDRRIRERGRLAAPGDRAAPRAAPRDARRRRSAANLEASHRGRHDLAGRHHDRRPELGAGRRGPAAGGGLRRADRPEAAIAGSRPATTPGTGSARSDPRPRSPPAPGRASARTPRTARPAGSTTRPPAAGCRSRPTWPRCPRNSSCCEHRDGPLRQFLEDLGAWDDDWEPIGPRPADYVRRGDLRNADWLIAHGTYFDPSDFWQLRPEAAPDGHRVAVAYLPANPRPVRPRPASVPRHARAGRRRLPGDRQPGLVARA